jgi:hypothetical protein
MQDLAISGTSDFKIFPGDAPGPPNHSVVEHGITRARKSKFVLGPQISLSAVQCMFVLAFWNMNCSLLCCYTLLQGCPKFPGRASSARLNFAQKCAVIKIRYDHNDKFAASNP